MPSYEADTLSGVFTLSLDAPDTGAARLRLSGHLDDAAALELLRCAASVVRCGCSRLVVDLDGITSYDDDATYAVVGCTRLARWLPDGVDVVAVQDEARSLADRAGVAAPVRPTAGAPLVVQLPDDAVLTD